jgi:hypothetical protein
MADANSVVLCRIISDVAAGPSGGDNASEYTVPQRRSGLPSQYRRHPWAFHVFYEYRSHLFPLDLTDQRDDGLGRWFEFGADPSAERNSIAYRAP